MSERTVIGENLRVVLGILAQYYPNDLEQVERFADFLLAKARANEPEKPSLKRNLTVIRGGKQGRAE
jgi:hypothetical protein